MIYRFSEGLAAVELNGKRGFVDKIGKQIIPCVYDISALCCDQEPFSEGLAIVCLNGKWMGFMGSPAKVVGLGINLS